MAQKLAQISPFGGGAGMMALAGRLQDILKKTLEDPLGYIVNWGRLYSLWPVHLETACCSVEWGATAGSRWDMERFGILEAFGSLRQCDLLVVLGTVNRKMAPRLKMIWEQMPDPKWCVAVGACAISGGLYVDSYNVLQGLDEILPVDVYIPGCPPSAQQMLEGVILLQDKIRRSDLYGRHVEEGEKKGE